jgi:hypothetical protein
LPLSRSGVEATVAKLTRDDVVAWAKAALKPAGW